MFTNSPYSLTPKEYTELADFLVQQGTGRYRPEVLGELIERTYAVRFETGDALPDEYQGDLYLVQPALADKAVSTEVNPHPPLVFVRNREGVLQLLHNAP